MGVLYRKITFLSIILQKIFVLLSYFFESIIFIELYFVFLPKNLR